MSTSKHLVLVNTLLTFIGRGCSGLVNLITITPTAHSVVKAKLVYVAEFIRLDKSPIKINSDDVTA